MICSKCETENNSIANFCRKCGEVISIKKENNYNSNIKKVFVVFFTLLACVLVSHLFVTSQYELVLVFDIIFGLLVIIFLVQDYKSIKRLLVFRKPNWTLLLQICAFTPIFAFLVVQLANFINQEIFDFGQSSYYLVFENSPAPLLLSIVSIAVFPAFFEEIAFRGIIYNNLRKVASLKSTILISSILFTMMHLSLLSIIWLTLLGLLFAYFRAKYRTLWYGVLCHFIYNSTIVIIDFLTNS